MGFKYQNCAISKIEIFKKTLQTFSYIIPSISTSQKQFQGENVTEI